MALTKPILNDINSFDIHVGFTFTFNSVGGDKVTGSRLVITDNTTNTVAYSAEQTRDGYFFILPSDASGITNKTSGTGGNYNAYIQTTDGNGNWSEASSRKQFYCFVTPKFEFTVNTTTITNATNTWYLNYTINPSYPTEDIDGMATYGFTLYNNDGSQSQTSGTLYTASRPDLNYTFTGLIDGAIYKIQANAVTNNQMQIATVLDEFNVAYDLPTPDGVITATNMCNDGYVLLQIDVNSISDLENYEYARIYRKDSNNVSEDWMLLIENYITMLTGGIYVYKDKYNRHGITYDYALTLVQFNGIESSYKITQVYSEFNGVFLVDLSTSYKFYAGVQYGDSTSVQKIGIHEPIGRKYPILVSNSIIGYQQGSLTASVLDNDYDTTRIINRFSITEQKESLDTFLKNKKTKILKDWNGNIWLCAITNSPTTSYNNSYGMGYIECSFEWTEQGAYDDYNALISGGLLSSLSPINVKVIGMENTIVSLTNVNGDMIAGTIGATGETIISTYSIGTYVGTATLTNSFGTQIKNISVNIIGGELNIIDITPYDLTVGGATDIYTESPMINLVNDFIVLNFYLSSETIVPIMQNGVWSGYAEGFGGQKQPISADLTSSNDTIIVESPSILTVNTVSSVSYSLSNTNSGYTNTINGLGTANYKLFTNGTWSGNSISIGNQVVNEFIDIISYATNYTLDIEYTTLTFEVTARLDDSVGMSLSNSGSLISNTIQTTNGAWNYKTTSIGARAPYDVAYGNGYYVMCGGNGSISYSTSLNGTWTSKTIGTSVSHVAYGNGYWVVTDNNGYDSGIWYCASTPNGTWTFVAIGADDYGFADIIYANGYWAVVIGVSEGSGDPPPSTENGIWYRASTPNGTWTFRNMITSGNIGNISYQNGYWVLLDYDRSAIWYRASTPNGTWMQKYIEISGITTTYPIDIAYGNGYWAIVDSINNSMYYTSGTLNSTWNGYTYTDEAYIPFNSFCNIKYIGGYWIISYSTGTTQSAICGILYRYGNINPSGGLTDFIKQSIISSSGGLFYVNDNLIMRGGTLNPPLPTRLYYYHAFPSTLPNTQSLVYYIIKSGTWSGSADIDNYTKTLSTTISNPPSGSVTLDIKDKGL